jgi:hypothetical protein
MVAVKLKKKGRKKVLKRRTNSERSDAGMKSMIFYCISSEDFSEVTAKSKRS